MIQCSKDQLSAWEDVSLGATLGKTTRRKGWSICGCTEECAMGLCLEEHVKRCGASPDNKVVYRKERAEKCVTGRHAILWTGYSLVVSISFCSGYIPDPSL